MDDPVADLLRRLQDAPDPERFAILDAALVANQGSEEAARAVRRAARLLMTLAVVGDEMRRRPRGSESRMRLEHLSALLESRAARMATIDGIGVKEVWPGAHVGAAGDGSSTSAPEG